MATDKSAQRQMKFVQNKESAEKAMGAIDKFKCCIIPSGLQLHRLWAPVMDLLRPGSWKGTNNSCKRTVQINFPLDAGDFKTCQRKIQIALDKISSIERQTGCIHDTSNFVDANFVKRWNYITSRSQYFKAHFFSKNKQWLDVITMTSKQKDFQVIDDGDQGTRSIVFSAYSFSAGLAPCSHLLCVLLGLIFWFVEFFDFGQNRAHIR